MKKIFLLCALIILATGCVNAKESSIPEYNSEADGVSASEALHILYDSFELNERGTRDYPTITRVTTLTAISGKTIMCLW